MQLLDLLPMRTELFDDLGIVLAPGLVSASVSGVVGLGGEVLPSVLQGVERFLYKLGVSEVK